MSKTSNEEPFLSPEEDGAAQDDADELRYDYADDTLVGRKKSLLQKERKERNHKVQKKLAARGPGPSKPAAARGKWIAATFWGQAFCRYLETYKEYDHRLARGRSHLRQDGVVALEVTEGQISAIVSADREYEVRVLVKPIGTDEWQAIIESCAARIGSLTELLTGQLAAEVMEVLTNAESGLFPRSDEIRFSCNCLDVSRFCEHAAAVLYGFAARLDTEPAQLFLLRSVQEKELVQGSSRHIDELGSSGFTGVDIDELGQLFGIDLCLDEGAKVP
jgi:hypothetical protein